MKSNTKHNTRNAHWIIGTLCALSIPNLYAPITIIESTSQLEKELNSKPYAVLEFYGSWCHVCQSIQKPFEAVANDTELQGKVLFAQIDIDKHTDLKTKYGVLGVPTFIYFKKGKKKQQDMGVHNMATFKDELRTTIKNQFKLTQSATK